MFRCNVFIIINSGYSGSDGLEEIKNSLIRMGAEIIEVDVFQNVIEAVVDQQSVSAVEAMKDVAYVRTSFTYFIECGVAGG